MKPYYFHPEALEEADQAIRFYEERQSGLGTRFLDALEDAIAHIQRHPRLYQIFYVLISKRYFIFYNSRHCL